MADDRSAAPAGDGVAAAGASGAEGGAEGAAAVVVAKPAAPAKLDWKAALDKVRDAVGATKGAPDPGHAGGALEEELPAETANEREERLSALEPDERAAEEAREAAAAAAGGGEAEPDERLIVDLGAMREGEEPIRIAAEDQQMADHMRSLVNRAATRDVSMRIREEAEAIRAQADEMRYEVQLDPAGFLLDNLRQSPTGRADASHIAKVLLTQPGVLDSIKDWVVALAETPQAMQAEARLANAERIERQGKVKPRVEAMKFENLNARQCVRAAYKAIDDTVPEAWTGDQRDRLVADVIRDLQDTQQRENVAVTNPARVAGLVKARLEPYGMAPKGAKRGAGGEAPGRPGTKTPARTGPSGQQLRDTETLRRRAASPGPGAGSPAAGIPRPPAGTKLTGKNNVFDFIRSNLKTLRRAP